MNKITKVAAASAAVAMSVSVFPFTTVNAEGEGGDVTKTESVYTVLNSDGTVSSVTVSDQLHSDKGFKNYKDKSDLKDVENLKSADEVKKEGNDLVWNQTGEDIFYQGTTTKELPLDVKITYNLDGKDVKEKDILGKSGHLSIKVQIENKQHQKFVVGDKEYDLVVPFVAAAGAMLDTDHFKNVTVNNGTVGSDSSHDIVAGVMIPGLRDGLNSVLSSDMMDSISSFLVDDITVEADVTDYEAPSIMLAAATDMDSLKEEIGDTGFTDISSQIDQLREATDKLMNGSQDLFDGASKLSDGANQLDFGAGSLSDGAAQAAEGASKLVNGASTLQAGLQQLTANNDTLNNGAATIFQGVIDTANSQLHANAALANVTLTTANYADVLAQLSNKDTFRPAALAQVVAQVQAADPSVSEDDVRTLIYMAAIHSTGDFSADIRTQAERAANAKQIATTIAPFTSKEAVLPLMNRLTGVSLPVINSTAYDLIRSKIAEPDDVKVAEVIGYALTTYPDLTLKNIEEKLTESAQKLTEAASVQVEKDQSQTEEGSVLINSTLDNLTDASPEFQNLSTLETSLNGIQQFVEGLKTYTAGVSSAYDGSKNLVDGASQLKNGIDAINAGSASLKDGASQVANGASALKDGSKTLRDGMKEYNDKAISKLTDSDEIQTLQDTGDLLNAVKEQGDSYNNYSGISDNTDGNVKFIYKVEGAKVEKKVDDGSENKKPKETFWDRVVNLFDLSTLFKK